MKVADKCRPFGTLGLLWRTPRLRVELFKYRLWRLELLGFTHRVTAENFSFAPSRLGHHRHNPGLTAWAAFWRRFAASMAVVGAIALLGTFAVAKEKEAGEKTVDSGSFGVFSGQHRLATETFTIAQGPQGSIVSSEFKSEQGEQKAQQSSRLELTPSVELREYTWKEMLPEKNQVTVTPNENFLIEHFSADDKQHEQNFLLPASTTILDDYSFIQREVLAWKYLHDACKSEKGSLGCPKGQKMQFGTLNPHARSSMPVTIEFGGVEKVTIRGKEQDLSRFTLHAETGDWAYWLDDQLKLVRLQSDGGVEVVRD